MGRMLGYMANRADRLGDVLEEERAAIAPAPDFHPDAWGIGFYQGGEVLHKKRPQLEGEPIDWEGVARGVRSDAVVIHLRSATVGDFRAENTHPFRMRQWLFAHTGTVEGFSAIRPRLLESMPDFLRRNVRGGTDSEHIFHVLLSFLHDAGQLDHPDADSKVVLGAVRSTFALLDRYCAEIKAPAPDGNLILTTGRTMYAVCRESPMLYAERSGFEPGEDSPKGGGAMRYVLVVSNGEQVPGTFEVLEPGHVLCIDRNLQVSTQPL